MSESASMNAWTRLTFGQMAEQVAERIEPTPDDGEMYVGLEHLDSGSLTVRRWGADVALVGTKLRMRKGDILFARRNAYLRRVALAPHDGLFSAHGMVLRARPHVVLPEFLPFFMQSDLFMDRAERISVGSLSPTINWGTLKEQEFALPPLDEQRRIAEAFVSFEAQVDALDTALEASNALASSLDETLTAGRAPRTTRRLGEVLSLSLDFRGRTPKKLGMDWGGDIPALSAMNVKMGRIDSFRETNFGSEALYKRWMTRGDLQADDVLFTTEAPLGNVCLLPDDRRYILSQRVVALRADRSCIRPGFLASVMRSGSFRQEMFQRATGTTAAGIRVASLLEIPVGVPRLAVQDDTMRIIEEAERTTAALEQRAAEARDLKPTALSRILRGDT